MRLEETIGTCLVSTVKLPWPFCGYETTVLRISIANGEVDWRDLHRERSYTEHNAREKHARARAFAEALKAQDAQQRGIAS